MEIDRCRPGAPAAAQLPTSFGSDPRRGHHRHSCSDILETATSHNARHQRARILNAFFASVPKVRRVSHRKIRRFSGRFDEGGGLKNRCRFERKMDPQVLISRYTYHLR